MQLTWTITLQRTSGGLPAETRSLARFRRSVGRPNPADVGLCRSEEQELVAVLQTDVVQEQITAHRYTVSGPQVTEITRRCKGLPLI
jgi:hypothetical protein